MDGFEVSNLGRIRSWRARGGGAPRRSEEPYIRALHRNAGGYKTITMKVNGRQHTMGAHRAVARAFLGDPPFDGAVVRHLDGDPSNNDVSNLRWGTAKENSADALKHGSMRRGSAQHLSKLDSLAVKAARDLHDLGWTHFDIADIFSVSAATIGHAVRGDTWAHV